MIRKQVKNSFKRIALLVGMILLATTYLTNCKNNEKPDSILTEQQMVHLLIDIYVIEEKASRVPVPYDSMNKLFPYFRSEILDRAGISDSTFKASWRYYMSEPKKLEGIYAAVVDSLNLREQSLQEANSRTDAVSE